MRMAQRQIIFDIDQTTGNVTIESKGFQGPSCKAATAPFEKLFGTPTSDTPTTEMQQKTAQQVTQGQG
jgi:hypothetical protein